MQIKKTISHFSHLYDLGQITAIDHIDFELVIGNPKLFFDAGAAPENFLEALEESLEKNTLPPSKLDTLIAQDKLGKLTSNPSIMEKAIGDTQNPFFRPVIQKLSKQGLTPTQIWTKLATLLVRLAAKKFETVFDQSGGRFGIVSLETDPLSENLDAPGFEMNLVQEYLKQARAFSSLSPHGNIDVKVASTPAGIEVLKHAIAEGIKINSTTIFPDTQVIDAQGTVDAPQYVAVAEAYISGLEAFVQNVLSLVPMSAWKQKLQAIVSVDSEFVSRVGVEVHSKRFGEKENAPFIQEFKMPLEIAMLKIIHEIQKTIYNPEYQSKICFTSKIQALKKRFAKLAALGANPKNLFFASTGVKPIQESFMRAIYGNNWNIAYVQELIAPATLATHPPETYELFNQNGDPRLTIQDHSEAALKALRHMYATAPTMTREVNSFLLKAGFKQFADAYQRTLAVLGKEM
jgi:transaldolase